MSSTFAISSATGYTIDKMSLKQWVYSLAQYLEENPIYSEDEINTMSSDAASDYLSDYTSSLTETITNNVVYVELSTKLDTLSTSTLKSLYKQGTRFVVGYVTERAPLVVYLLLSSGNLTAVRPITPYSLMYGNLTLRSNDSSIEIEFSEYYNESGAYPVFVYGFTLDTDAYDKQDVSGQTIYRPTSYVLDGQTLYLYGSEIYSLVSTALDGSTTGTATVLFT